MPTALIVEDEPEANKLLAMLLQLRGYNTESVFRGSEALEIIRDTVPDVVFLDLMLPDMSGYEVCRSMKATASNRLTPVVIVTARLAAENRIASFEVGADDYIPKPYTPDQIFQALENSATWKDQIAAPRVEGEVPLDVRDDGETLRRLAQLRRLTLVRSGIATDEMDRISAAIKELWSSVNGWSRQRQANQVATLSYSITPESLTLTVRDEAGWLESAYNVAINDPTGNLAQARFDEVFILEDQRVLKLVKRFVKP